MRTPAPLAAGMDCVRFWLGIAMVVALPTTLTVFPPALADDVRGLAAHPPGMEKTHVAPADTPWIRADTAEPIRETADGSSGTAAQEAVSASTPGPEGVDGDFAIRVPDSPGSDEPLRPIPADMGTDPEKVALGRALFHDPRLSRDNTTACVSCHDLGSGGDDGRRVSVGVEGRLGSINAPTVFNVGLQFKQFWDGRANTLQQQIDGPVQSPVELGTLWPDVIEKLYSHESYPGRFQALYPDGISRENAKDALAEFMKSLTTPHSPFDRWLEGEEDAIGALEKRGYALFKHYGCSSCHQGANVGGNMFQVFGVLNDYFRKRGDITEADLGRYNVTGNPEDRHSFKVPSLRMAALTAPYLHDGSAETLRDAVDAMFEYQLGREAPDEDKEAIVAFIESLAGESRELDP
ncbi:MAG: cytochrome C biogenesis protein CcsA [Rhodospirillales bacterium]|nr:cytochrome C biogenesis protein CcsA [Rhodospirillales bacterium]MDE0382038.1 cytochrome C biogenesis protein CcsA [Rhodospirillales bacterium]